MAGLYDAFYESTRRKLADAIFKRDLKESLEEESLRRQLAEADLEIKSLKKSIRNNPEINEFACRNDIERYFCLLFIYSIQFRSLQFRYPVPGKPSLMSIRLVQAVPSEDAPCTCCCVDCVDCVFICENDSQSSCEEDLFLHTRNWCSRQTSAI